MNLPPQTTVSLTRPKESLLRRFGLPNSEVFVIDGMKFSVYLNYPGYFSVKSLESFPELACLEGDLRDMRQVRYFEGFTLYEKWENEADASFYGYQVGPKYMEITKKILETVNGQCK
jgi:hypothetical protein